MTPLVVMSSLRLAQASDLLPFPHFVTHEVNITATCMYTLGVALPGTRYLVAEVAFMPHVLDPSQCDDPVYGTFLCLVLNSPEAGIWCVETGI